MKKNKLLLVSLILGLLYFIFIFTQVLTYHFTQLNQEQIGFGLASIILFPHTIATGVAVIVNYFALTRETKKLILSSAILYIIAMILFLPLFYGTIISAVLCLITYNQQRKDTTIL